MDSLRVLVDEILLHLKPRMRIDDVVEHELIAQYIRDARAATVVREYAGKRSLNGFTQTIDVVIEPMESTIRVISNGKEKAYPYESNGIYRIDMPNIISGLDRFALHYFGSADMQNAYDVIYAPVFSATKYSRWGLPKPILYTNASDTYVYIPYNIPVVARIVAIFSNPEDVYGFTWDTSYPIPTETKESITYIVRAKLLEHIGMPVDITNNNVNEIAYRGEANGQKNEQVNTGNQSTEQQ